MTAFSPYQAYPGPQSSMPVAANGPLPVLVAVADPVPQSRLTVFFRLLLSVPHAFVLEFVGIAAGVVAFLGWWGALFTGRLPAWAAEFLTGYLRWQTRVAAYNCLLTDAYPPFSMQDEPGYPVRVAVPAGQRLNRAAVFFRGLLVIPALILGGLLALGAGLVSIVAWFIALVAGTLPVPLHRAFAAFIRYYTRYVGYYLMLTPAYPGGLYGDQPGTPAWADQGPAAMPPAPGGPGAVPGYGTPGSVYGGPAVPGAYPAPGGYGTQPGYGTPPGYEPPQPGYGAQPGYGVGYAAAPGYPAPVGYGYPGAVAVPAAGWLLVLTSGARRLVTTFIVVGVLVAVGYGIIYSVVIGKAVSRSSDIVTANTALLTLSSANQALGANMDAWQTATKACNGNLTCVTKQDTAAAGYFTSFDSKLRATTLPPGSAAAGTRLDQAAATVAQDFTRLAGATTADQYQSTFDGIGLQAALDKFDTDYSALITSIEST